MIAGSCFARRSRASKRDETTYRYNAVRGINRPARLAHCRSVELDQAKSMGVSWMLDCDVCTQEERGYTRKVIVGHVDVRISRRVPCLVDQAL